jgi:alpha-D-ribose 1-methylphosphonate 5-triphosphate synthase subunit PhnG
MQTTAQEAPSPALEDRKRRIEYLALATREELQRAFEALAFQPEVKDLRGPETGLVMIRGRMGGTGSLFNLGEATVSRATVQLSDGTVGHGQRLGGDKLAARLSAIFDALGETRADAEAVEALCRTVVARVEADAARLSAETAATRVDFFTMVRGDD